MCHRLNRNSTKTLKCQTSLLQHPRHRNPKPTSKALPIQTHTSVGMRRSRPPNLFRPSARAAHQALQRTRAWQRMSKLASTNAKGWARKERIPKSLQTSTLSEGILFFQDSSFANSKPVSASRVANKAPDWPGKKEELGDKNSPKASY